uniref:Thioredoxin n=1 Tax=candidate division WOR-3 bacterium TaxID=2052148 RepID=A0A7C4TCN1_UNCW3
MIKELTDIDFFQEVEKSSLPYLVYFWAIWSPVCISITHYLEEIDEKFAGKINIGKVNVDNEIKTANEFDIQNIPTMIFFINGVAKERITGSISKEFLLKKVKKYLVQGEDKAKKEVSKRRKDE